MTSKERREKGLLFIADASDWVEMKRARLLTKETMLFAKGKI